MWSTEKREEKAASFPQDGEGKRTTPSEELFGEEGTSIGNSVPVRGFVVLSHSTDQSSSLLCLQQDKKLPLGVPHLWFLLGSPRAVPHHPDPRGLLPPLKVLWHLKKQHSFHPAAERQSPLGARMCLGNFLLRGALSSLP